MFRLDQKDLRNKARRSRDHEPLPRQRVPGKITLTSHEGRRERRKPRAPGKVSLTSRLRPTKIFRRAKEGADLELLVDNLPSRGQRLPDSLSGDLGTSLGTDVSDVRIHTGSQANKAASALNAEAFTIGKDIYFGAGYYAPNTERGRHLIAHEVAHTAQQQGAPATGAVEVSEPGDQHEVEAEGFADAFTRQSRGEPGAIVRPSRVPLITPVSRRIIQAQELENLTGPDTTVIHPPDVDPLFPEQTILDKEWNPKPKVIPLASATFLVNGIPINYDLSGEAAASSKAGVTYGPGKITGQKVWVTGAEGRRLKNGHKHPHPAGDRKALPIVRGTFGAAGDISFQADASASANASFKLDNKLSLPTEVFYASAYAGLKASVSANAGVKVTGRKRFDWTGGSGANLNVLFQKTAKASLALKLDAVAGVKVGLKFPDIPVVTDLTSAVQDWPIAGWVTPNLEEWKWEKEYEATWPIVNKTYDWEIKQSYSVIGSGTATAKGDINQTSEFDWKKALADLGSAQRIADDPKGPEDDKRNSNPSSVAASRANANTQIQSAKRAAEREMKANSRLLKRAHNRPKMTGGTQHASSGPNDLINQLKKRHDKLKQAINALLGLQGKSDALSGPATAPDGPTRNSARGGYEAVAKNADKLGDAINSATQGFEVPEGATPDDESYKAYEKAMRAAYAEFDGVFDKLFAERRWAADQLTNAGNLQKYKADCTKYKGQCDTLCTSADALESDMDRAREWYDKHDHALGEKVFRDELMPRIKRIKKKTKELPDGRPKPNWDETYVELDRGRLMLKAPFRTEKRKRFYPHDYPEDIKAINQVDQKKTIDGVEHWHYGGAKSGRGDNWWKVNDKQERPTIEHKPSVKDHWNSKGRTTTQPKRKAWYQFADGRKPIVMPKSLNSSEGASGGGGMINRVTVSFRGP